jgi:hypothetical protein
MATGNIHKGIMAGKLNGVIPAVTPSGKRYEYVSKSLLMLGSVSPSWSDVTLQQCSTTSAQAYQQGSNLNSICKYKTMSQLRQLAGSFSMWMPGFSSCGICGGQIGTRADFLASFHPTKCSILLCISQD